MYLLMGMFIVIAGVCLFVLANRMAKKRAAVIGIQIVGIVLLVIGVVMTGLLLSGKVVLPLSGD